MKLDIGPILSPPKYHKMWPENHGRFWMMQTSKHYNKPIDSMNFDIPQLRISWRGCPKILFVSSSAHLTKICKNYPFSTQNQEITEEFIHFRWYKLYEVPERLIFWAVLELWKNTANLALVKYDIVHMCDQAFSKQPLNEFGSLPKNDTLNQF